MVEMTTRLVNTQTGDSQVINLQFFVTFNDLCKFILNKWGIPIDRIELLMGPMGIKLDKINYNTILHTPLPNDTLEIWCFDRSGLYTANNNNNNNNNNNRNDLLLIKPIPSPFVDATKNTLTYNELIYLLTTNLGWLSALEIDGFYLNELNEKMKLQVKFLIRGVYIYHQYLISLLNDLTNLLTRNHDFYNNLLDDRSNLDWRRVFNSILNKLIIFQVDGANKTPRTLQDLVELNTLTKFDTQMNQLQSVLDEKFIKITNDLDQIKHENNELTSRLNDMKSKEYLSEVEENEEEEDSLLKFKESISHVKEFSRNILNDSTYNDTTTKLDNNLIYQLEELHKHHLTYLFQESNTLYDKSLKLIDLKGELQQELKTITSKFHQIQINIMDSKKSILNNLNRGLKQFQSLDVAFAHMEDLPIVYGLYIIEMWRKLNWTLFILIKYNNHLTSTQISFHKECTTRTKWLKTFGSISSIFINDDSANITDTLTNSNVILLNIESLEYQLLGSIDSTNFKSTIMSLKTTCNELLNFIEHYITSFDKLTDNKEVIKVLRKRVMEAQINQFDEVVGQDKLNDIHQLSDKLDSKSHEENDPSTSNYHHTTNPNKSDSSDTIQCYKRRIQKLESLLHEAKYSNLTSWPTTLLNDSTINSKDKYETINSPGLVQNFVDLKEMNEAELKLLKIRAAQLTEELNQLTLEMGSLKEELSNKEATINQKNSKLSDMNLEKSAYKETLTNLNMELLRLTNSEDKLTAEISEQKAEYINDIQKLLDNNKVNNERSQKANDKIRNGLEEKIKQLEDEKEHQRKIYEEEKEVWKKSQLEYEIEVTSLKKQNEILKEEKEKLVFNQIEDVSSKPVISESSSIKEYQSTLLNLENKLFNIFKANVFILENMGLLLTNETGDNSISSIEIKRVKGLRKNSSHTLLDESIHKAITLDENKVIQSDVYHKLKDTFEIYHENYNRDLLFSSQSFTAQLQPYLEKIYDNKLYEQAVIKRFGDMETLAKKLTRENKSNRTLLDKFDKEKITLKNFKIGDLALFLPTRDNIHLNRDQNLSVSSFLTSSFSSVDLSTPPIPTPSPGDITDIMKETAKPKPALVDKCPQNGANYSRLWAIFTAFDDDTRYLLKTDNSSELLKNRDWFIGKILTIDEGNILDNYTCSVKSQRGVMCYQVTAEVIPQQIQ
ncbi:autophagy-related protein 11 [Monosporozyma servazzii]